MYTNPITVTVCQVQEGIDVLGVKIAKSPVAEDTFAIRLRESGIFSDRDFNLPNLRKRTCRAELRKGVEINLLSFMSGAENNIEKSKWQTWGVGR